MKKICKHCHKEYFGNWAKTVESPFCSRECARAYSTAAKRKEINAKVSKVLKGMDTNKGGKIPVYENYLKSPKICPICNSPIPWEKRMRQTCSNKCGRILGVQKNRKNGLYERCRTVIEKAQAVLNRVIGKVIFVVQLTSLFIGFIARSMI